MGREVKRVAIDLQFQLNQTWPGYINPHKFPQCPDCEGRGTSASYRALETIVRLLMLAGQNSAERPKDFKPNGRSQNLGGKMFPHPWLTELSCWPIDDPGEDLHLITTGLCRQFPAGRIFGHDSVDQWKAMKAIVTAAGQDPDNWGSCKACNGQGWDRSRKAEYDAYEAWERVEPTPGEGYQIWETVSEGSPITPVFASPEDLALYCSNNRVNAGGGEAISYERWLAFISGPGWAPSFFVGSGGIQSGVSAVTRENDAVA